MHPSISPLKAAPANSSGARLLVVDDDRSVREMHARVLSLAGYQVVTAGDGAAALERLAANSFDLVLTDKVMPNLSGINIVLALRSAGSEIPVVMVSGSLALHPLPPMIAREIFAALPKPARISEVVSAVALALHAHRAEEHPAGRRDFQISGV